MSNKVRNHLNTKGQGRSNKRSRSTLNHQTWSFKPRLHHEAAILHGILDTYTIEFYTSIVCDVKELITSLIREHGFTDGAKRYGVIKTYTLNLIELRNPENPPWVSTSKKYSIPSKLGKNFIQLIVDYFEGTEAMRPKYYQVISTILNIVRMIDGLSEPDVCSITDKAKPIDNDLLAEFDTYVESILTPHKFDPTSVDLTGYRFNLMKNGPNGKPKIETAYEEAIVLLGDKSIAAPFRRICSELQIEYLYSYLRRLYFHAETNNQLSAAQGIKLRKLAKVPDSGFKTRIVAVVDFWTQLVMMPVRDHVQDVTKRLYKATDFRLNQDHGVQAMVDFQNRCLASDMQKEHQLDIKSLKFYDISSWTDRFHRDLQLVVMRRLFGPRLAQAWAQLCVYCQWNMQGSDLKIKYGQGQGMGTNGSFDIATLTDHLFINFIIDKKSSISGVFPNNACYGKVGDDLWIYDPDGLIKIYYDKINLPINLNKSKEYSPVGSVAEFCARTYLNGYDVSRISPKIISKSRDFRYIPLLLALCASRGVQLDRASFEILERKSKKDEVTYFDKLQPWFITLLAIGTKETSITKDLTLEYLRQGNWISESTEKLISDPEKMSRLSIAHSIVSIAKDIDSVKMKVQETMKIQFAFSWNDWSEFTDCNLFMKGDWKPLLKFLQIDREILLPKELILLQRLIDQQRSAASMPTGMLELADDLGQLNHLADQLHRIAYSVEFDRTNINYDTKRVYSTQFAMVETMQRLSEDFNVLTLDDSSDVMAVKQFVLNDLNGQGWGKELPELTAPTSTTS